MAFFVVERSALDSSLSIPLPEAFPTREAAIAALSAAVTSGILTLAGEVFVCDLGTAVPVLVIQAAATTGVSEAGAATVDEAVAPAGATGRVGSLDEGEADEAYASWEPLEDVLSAEGPSLADALKRATTSLEGEGIVAPDSIESGGGVTVGVTEDVEMEPTVPGDVAEDVVLEVALPASATLESADDGQGAEWPWANVQAYEILGVTADDEAEPVETDATDEAPDEGVAEDADIEEPDDTLAGTVAADESSEELPDLAAELSALGVSPTESVPEEAPIITGAPSEGEDAYLPQPVILGAYADDSAVGVPADFGSEPESVTQTPAEGDAGYAATGELDLGEYECTDCVYSNTCPKVGQATPADCGSFQWRSA